MKKEMISWEQTQSLYKYKGDGVKRLEKKSYLYAQIWFVLAFFSLLEHKNDIMRNVKFIQNFVERFWAKLKLIF